MFILFLRVDVYIGVLLIGVFLSVSGKHCNLFPSSRT